MVTLHGIKARLMKIGIVTFTYGDNYGQRLQNCAVQEILKGYANDVVTIPQSKIRNRGIVFFKNIYKYFINGEMVLSILRHRSFGKFDFQFIKYNRYSVIRGKLTNEGEFDFFVAGSDQIWSPFSPDVNSTMFLTFTDKKKRIALSPSISAEVIPEEQREKYKKYFEGFSHLSVREDKGAEIIKELTGRDASVLIDPTLMHSATFWNKYIKAPISFKNGKYACCYFLGTPQKAEKIREICKKYGLNRIDILGDKKYKVLGPQEFLYLIKNASVVITDSYHGCIFSCIFHIPFILCEREGTNINMNSRFSTLFKKLEINNRRLLEIEIEDALSMDFASIDRRVENERELVKEYLDNAFKRTSKQE